MELIIRLAKRNIFRNTRRTLLTVALIASGLAALIFTDAMVEGMSRALVKNSTQTFMGEAQVHRPGFRASNDVDLYIEDSQALYKALDANSQLASYSARTLSGGMISSSANVSSAMIYGIDAEKEAAISKIQQAVVEGSYLRGEKSTELLLGYKMAELLEVGLGDRLVLTLSQAKGGELSQELFRVSGIFRFNDRLMDQNLIFINLSRSQQLLGIGEGVHEVALKFHRLVDASDPSLSFWRSFNTEHWEALGWHQLMPQISSILEISHYSTLIVAGILFALVALGLINSMFMSIYERHYEFGVLLAIGTRPRQLFWQILCEGFFIGLISIVLGAVVGGLLSYWKSITGIDYTDMEFSGVTLTEPIYLVMRVEQFTLLPLSVLLITVLSCLYPAAHAAKLEPSNAMRRAL